MAITRRLRWRFSVLTVASAAMVLSFAVAASALPLHVIRASKHASKAPRLYGLRVTSGTPYSGDRALLATVSPNGDGLRDQAVVRFRLTNPATVKLRVMICRKHPTTVLTTETAFSAGRHQLVWAPAPDTPPQTYRLLVTVADGGSARPVHGCGEHKLLPSLPPAPVVRVMGIDAGFTQRSYVAGGLAKLRVATDVPSFRLQFFQAGPETQPTLGTEMEGVPVSEPRQVEWWLHRNASATISLRLGDWANGIYFARLTAPDGQNYYAPLIVRPHPFGAHRVAVVLETNTWEAYNHYDTNGDGWGDTWYAANDIHTVDLTRPYTQGGAPPHWLYDAIFLNWLYRSGRQVDFLSDDDLEHFRSAKTLSRLYDLIVFAGHEEYVTSHAYNLISGYRNLGGNLMFLSADNLAWKIDRHGKLITRIAEWRTLGRPESRVIGVQYRANDEGLKQAPYELTPYGQQSWQFAGVSQAALDKLPLFGVEFDMTTPASPAGTQILAQVNPHFPNPTIRGEMTYYESRGAKVFAAGTLNFTGGLVYSPISELLENVWQRLATPGTFPRSQPRRRSKLSRTHR